MDTENPADTRVYNGTTYYFCSKDDAQEFDSDPESYA